MKLNFKYRRRLLLISSYSLNTLIVPVISFFISFLVVKLKNVELWGELVYYIIIINLASHILGWGQNEYLLRDFSLNPSKIAKIWQNSLINRLPLFIIIFLLISFLNFSLERKLIICLWLITLFFYKFYEPLVLYKKNFSFVLKLETFIFIIFVTLLFLLRERLDLTFLLLIFASTSLIKTAAASYYFHRDVYVGFSGRLDPTYLKVSFPFFIPSFIGLIQTRTDLYCVAYFLSNKEVGKYQILINLLFYLQSVASLIIKPFLKNIYRLPDRTLYKLAFSLFRGGVIIAVPAMVLIYFILFFYYRFEFSINFYILGYFFVIPFYLYLVKIYHLFKHDKQNSVVVIAIIATGLNLILNLILIQKLGIQGALLASTITQWMILILYFRIKKFHVISPNKP